MAGNMLRNLQFSNEIVSSSVVFIVGFCVDLYSHPKKEISPIEIIKKVSVLKLLISLMLYAVYSCILL